MALILLVDAQPRSAVRLFKGHLVLKKSVNWHMKNADSIYSTHQNEETIPS
jgi:hypothetical protein